MSLLDGVRRVLCVHAHPDDETLSTGVLLAHLAEHHVETAVVTATRGEQGEIVPGVLPDETSDADLSAHREGELAAAVAALGVTHHFWLGTAPARPEGHVERRYRDSGMRWVTATVAGPGEDADERSLTSADQGEILADLGALIRHLRPDLLVTYDEQGGYGHPDHVALHQATRVAAAANGIRALEVVPTDRADDGRDLPGVEWLDRPDLLPAVTAALRAHASQLTIDGVDVVHVGGQREAIATRLGLREIL